MMQELIDSKKQMLCKKVNCFISVPARFHKTKREHYQNKVTATHYKFLATTTAVDEPH
jgi:hypothetical protein